MEDSIPSEIWSNHIFTKIPARSLSRFKCVCKAWNEAISDPVFVRTHSLCRNTHVYLEYNNKESIYAVDSTIYAVDCEINETAGTCKASPTKQLFTDIIHVKGSSNGLLFGLVKISDKEDLAIWNPSTEDFKLIPAPPYCNAHWGYGFYYDPFTGDANIVTFDFQPKNFRSNEKAHGYIYSSLKPNAWKVIENSIAPTSNKRLNFMVSDKHHGCGSNGSIYWILYNERITGSCDGWNIVDARIDGILVFDIKNKTFGKVPHPFGFPAPQRSSCRFQLGVFGSSIVLYEFLSPRTQQLVMWALKEGETKEWVKYDIKLPESVSGPHPLCTMRNRQILIRYFDSFEENRMVKMLLYDLVNEQIQDLAMTGIPNIYQPKKVTKHIISHSGRVTKHVSFHSGRNVPKIYVAFVSLN